MLSATNIKAQQNLVYNGGFELYSTCPLGLTDPFNNEIIKCLGWDHPTYATSDYYNACSPFGLGVSVPNNVSGTQIPLSGNAYCGFYSYALAPSNLWEYITGTLINPLIQNHKYKVTFYVVLGERYDLYTKNIGAYLSSTKPLNYGTTAPLPFTPQVLYSNYISDTVNWVKVSNIITAQGGENYITIGHFSDTLNSDTVRFHFWDPPNNQAYYLVDSASVFDITDISNPSYVEYPNIFTPNSDGINDELIFKNKNILDWNLTIFDRWGLKIFETNDPNNNWDGHTTSGESNSDGVYYYLLNAKGKDDKLYRNKGFIQLIH